MTTQQALQLLDQAASMAPLPREGHRQVMEAVEVLIKALQPAAPQRQPDAGE